MPPRGWRRKCEDCLRLDVRQLKTRDVLRAGASFSMSWSRYGLPGAEMNVGVDENGLAYCWTPGRGGIEDVSYRIEFTRTPCRFGGTRTWFVCPDCGRRCAVLYGLNGSGRISCRRCMKLAYVSEALKPARRRLERQWRGVCQLAARLTENGERPKWMRRRTYERIRGVFVVLEDANDPSYISDALEVMRRTGDGAGRISYRHARRE